MVYDDPSFGSEPMLRASEVTADLRLSSLLRGRLEVSKLDLTEPSLNLVHRGGGGWNIETLLERTAHLPMAPTGKAKSEPRPAFPYIEGSTGRINFKNGPEKKPYALTNADFALWQESENTWGVRLKAQPFRSDMNLNDTGLLQVNGTWQRAENFRYTPLQFSLEWSQAQLGQVTKFFTGSDKGWRGDLLFDVSATGTPAALKISSTVLADDFRRSDITIDKSLRLALRCEAEYRAREHVFREISCGAPVGTGSITITGEARLFGNYWYALNATAAKVPATAIGALARRVKKDLPDDLALEGNLQGQISISANAETGKGPRAEGRAEIVGLRVSSASGKAELGPLTIPIMLATASSDSGRDRATAQMPWGIHAEVGPFVLERHAGAATVRGWADRSGYSFSVLGDAEVGRTLRVARLFGLHALRTTAEGTAQLDLHIGGSWAAQNGVAGFGASQVTGSAKLRNVHFGLRGTSEPVEITSAEMQLSSGEVRVGKLNVKAAGAAWKGSVETPRGCGVPENCPVRFQLNTDELSLDEANAWANPNPKDRPWYRVLGNAQPQASILARVWAFGSLRASRFVVRGITASKLSANVSLNSGKLEISALEADVLGGKHQGKWRANFGVKPAACNGSGDLAGISLANVSKLMKDDWVEGTASASYDIQGPCTHDFWQSLQGTLKVSAADGSLPHVFLDDSVETMKIRNFSGRAQLHDGTIEVTDAQLDSPQGKYEVSGTATLEREIDFRLTRVPAGSGTSAYTITGTVAQPHVTAVSRTEQARLKPPTK